jgi:hypothetical protein
MARRPAQVKTTARRLLGEAVARAGRTASFRQEQLAGNFMPTCDRRALPRPTNEKAMHGDRVYDRWAPRFSVSQIQNKS